MPLLQRIPLHAYADNDSKTCRRMSGFDTLHTNGDEESPMEYAEARGYGRPLRVAYLVIDSVWKHELVFRGQRTFAALDETRPATDARHVARYATKGILPSYTTTQASMKPPCAPVATTSRSCHRAAKLTCPFDTPDRSSTHFWLLGPTLICRDLRRDRCPVRRRCHRVHTRGRR